MNWFECLTKAFVDELTGATSQPLSPEEEIERYISEKRSTAMAINITINKVSPTQAKILEKQLADLKKEIAEAQLKRDTLLRRMNTADKKMQFATNPLRNPFERMEEKVKEAEEAAQVAQFLALQQNISNKDLS